MVLPKNIEELHAGVELAAKHGVPILPRTGGSSLAGQTVNEAVVFDLKRHLNRLLEVNTEEHWVRVEPGVVLDQFNCDLAKHMVCNSDLTPRAAIARGWVASLPTTPREVIRLSTAWRPIMCWKRGVSCRWESCAFWRRLREHGSRRQARRGLKGSIYRELSKLIDTEANRPSFATTRRDIGDDAAATISIGSTRGHDATAFPPDPRFNLAKLMCGSEGTLGVMHEIKVNLVTKPDALDTRGRAFRQVVHGTQFRADDSGNGSDGSGTIRPHGDHALPRSARLCSAAAELYRRLAQLRVDHRVHWRQAMRNLSTKLHG